MISHALVLSIPDFQKVFSYLSLCQFQLPCEYYHYIHPAKTIL